ncbi:MAG TPA: formate dehydrogenase beta subunit [Devosia sp.]|nr:formate dehydrogenase beta subunit [Devosia sp.]
MRTRIFVPGDSGAVSVGADRVAAAFIELAKTGDKKIDLVRTGSRGMYWLEPLVEVETPEGRLAYGPVTAQDVASVWEATLTGDTGHSLCLGLVDKIEFLKKQNRVMFSRLGIIDPLNIDDYQAHGGLEGLKKALSTSPDDIVEAVAESGLRGRGGAGFPAGIKWRTVAAQDAAEQKYICCNADEGDSGTFADRMLMEGDPFLLLEGMIIAGLAVGATHGLIYVRSEYPAATKSLKMAIDILRDAGWLGETVGGSKHAFDITVRRGAGSYVCGEESAMLESLEGKRGEVRAKPPIPAISGLFGQPTLVHNVLTLASVPTILADGAGAYKALGTGRSRGTQAFQLAGNVKHGGLVEVAFGLTIRELIEDFGGGTASGKPFKCAQLGGPLGAYVDEGMLDLPMDYEALAGAGAMLGHGGIVVFDENTDMAEMARFAFEFCAIESCGKCTPCRIGAVRGRELMDKLIAGKDIDSCLTLIKDLCEVMEEGSMCAMGGLTPLPVKSAIKLFPADFGLAPDGVMKEGANARAQAT